MYILAFEIDPVLLAPRPDIANAFAKWVLPTIIVVGTLIKHVCVMIVWVEEGAIWNFRILMEILRVTDINLIILK